MSWDPGSILFEGLGVLLLSLIYFSHLRSLIFLLYSKGYLLVRGDFFFNLEAKFLFFSLLCALKKN